MDNTSMSPEMTKQVMILEELKEQYPNMTYQRMSGRNDKKHNIYIDNKNIGEVWCVLKEMYDTNGKIKNAGVYYTDCISLLDKEQSIDISARDYDKMGDHLNDRYAFHSDWMRKYPNRGFHYSIRPNDFLSLKKEIEKSILYYLKTQGKEVIVDDINIARKPSSISSDGLIVVCPRCDKEFKKAERCPNCGQLILY